MWDWGRHSPHVRQCLPAGTPALREQQSRDAIVPNSGPLKFLTAAAVAASLGVAPAKADIFDKALGLFGLASPQAPAAVAPAPAALPPVMVPDEPEVSTRQHLFSARAAELSEFSLPRLPSLTVAELPLPSVETPIKKLFCVEFARARSGLALFGDAKFWWARAKNIYARLRTPAEETVMVFTATKRLAKGHVAVVTHIVSSREIRVDQANWQNHGEIDRSTPVLDVSKKNDWSQVRVWDIRSKSFGGHVYPVSGFIAKDVSQRLARE